MDIELKEFLRQMTPDQRQQFAARVGTSVGHLKNVGYGYRTCAAALARAIEDQSGQRVMRWSLLPDDWHEIWPDLKSRQGAPKPAAQGA